MGKFRFKWPGKKQNQSKSAALGQTSATLAMLSFGLQGGETPASALNLYRKSTAVSVPVNMIADSFAGISPVIKIDDTIEKDHEVLDLLRNPNSFFTKTLLFQALAVNYLVTDEAEIVAQGNINRPPLALMPISPAFVNVTMGSDGFASVIDVSGVTLAGAYVLDRKGKLVRYVNGSLKEIKQIRGFSTQNNSLLRGESKLNAASAEARQHILGNTHNSSLLEKGGRLSTIFHFKQDMTVEDFNETQQRVRSQYGGASSAGEIGITAGEEMDIKEFGINNKDMDYVKLDDIVKAAISLQYKVPLPLISNTAATFNNYKEAKLALYDDAVLPLADKIFDDLTNFLMPRFGLDPAQIKITYDIDDITALAVRRNEELKLRKDLNLESDNEMRSMIGREPYETGNRIYKPVNLVAVGTDDDEALEEPDEPTVARNKPDDDELTDD